MTDPSVPMERLKQEVTSVTLVNNTQKTVDVTVPQGERWLLLWWNVTNPDDVVRNMTVSLYKELAKTNVLAKLLYKANVAAASVERFGMPHYKPTVAAENLTDYPILLAAGNTISFVWSAGGASAGGTDADGLIYCYLKVEI